MSLTTEGRGAPGGGSAGRGAARRASGTGPPPRHTASHGAWFLVLPALMPILVLSVGPLLYGILLAFTDAQSGRQSVHDAGWSSFISMLEYKAERYGRTLVKIGRFEPTSQIRSTCGVKDGPKPLNVRGRTCTVCGTVHDRDANAAINVKTTAGLAASACGAPVRPGAIPAQREETGSHGFPTEPRAA